MSNTPLPLLQQRYKCIGTDGNHYPGSKFVPGDILIESPLSYAFKAGVITTAENIIPISDIVQHPHLFRPMQWWEGRTVEEMPEYVTLEETYRLNAVKYNMGTPLFMKIRRWGVFDEDKSLTNYGKPYAVPDDYNAEYAKSGETRILVECLLPATAADYEAYKQQSK